MNFLLVFCFGSQAFSVLSGQSKRLFYHKYPEDKEQPLLKMNFGGSCFFEFKWLRSIV